MPENKKKEPVEISEQEIQYLDHVTKNIDADLAVAMAYVKRTQRLTFNQLQERFCGININTMKRYMQPSYPSMRPLHFLAAYSWVTMVPLTSFYYKIVYPEMDSGLLKVLMCIGKLPSKQFNAVLEIMYELLNDDEKQKSYQFRAQLEAQYGPISDLHSFPPNPLDINEFSEDYYRSVAITVKQFRENNNIPINTITKVLGLSRYQYQLLEKKEKNIPFPSSIGARIKLGFKLESHANFTSQMQSFPEFHRLRRVQHARDLLVMDTLNKLSVKKKKRVFSLLTILSQIYIK